MPDSQRKAQKKTPLSEAQSREPHFDPAAAQTPQRDFLGLAPAKPGGDTQAHATALTRTAGNRLARAGQAILQLQRQYGNRYVQRVVDFARKITSPGPIQARAENKTGLPDDLKTNVENLSGLALDDVKVHYNSNKPAQVQALAYTQGADIHVAPGQETHLPHETWHVVQQKQGRVQPTLQTKDLSLNDDPGLEHEATVMGDKAIEPSPPTNAANVREGAPAQLKSETPIQRLLKYPYTVEGDRLQGPPQKIELTQALPYQTLIEYKSIWNEKQLGAPHRQWEFEAGDVNTLNQLIEEKEGDLGQVRQVICPEGEVKVALPGQSITFGDVTSCMTINVVLDDDSLISAHNGQMTMGTLPNAGINRINQLINGRQIVNVLAIGAGTVWDTRIKSQLDDNNGRFLARLVGPDDNDLQKQLNAVNINAFETYLSGRFGNAPTTFQEHDQGVASITAARNYRRG